MEAARVDSGCRVQAGQVELLGEVNVISALSLGWGVQSWTIAAMAALGELDRPDYTVHADTTWERQSTYEFAVAQTEWLANHGINIITVSDLAQAQKVHTSKTDIPAFTTNGQSDGQLRRQCTGRWKITPIRRFLQTVRNGQPVEQWMGISLDEMGRAGSSDVKYIKHRYPLLEKRMTRGDCIQWLSKRGLPIPQKSSCVFCPYHNRQAWNDLKRNAADWNRAISVDEQIRSARPPFDLFVHPSRKPLVDAVVLPEDIGFEQISLLEQECGSGYCFV